MNFKRILKKIISYLVCGIISSIVAFFIALLIQNRFKLKIYDAMTVIGLIIICFGVLSTDGETPIGVDRRSPDDYGQYAQQLNLEVTKMESGASKYIKRVANHTNLNFTITKLNIILNGVFVILSSIVISLISN